MRPFLLLQSRPEEEASEDEYRAFLRFGGLEPHELVRKKLYEQDYDVINLDDYSGILMGGGPNNFAKLDSHKSPEQRAYEDYVLALIEQIVQTDTPFLGVCLGVGALVTQQGGHMSFGVSEPVRAVDVRVSELGASDPLLAGVDQSFRAFVGHKEGVARLPDSLHLLAGSDACAQVVRAGNNVYATQYHPELDADGIALRLRVYQHAGYCHPDEVDVLVAAAQQEQDIQAPRILENFIERYRSRAPLQ
ncbi:glutamine amidotransferase [Candidatus Saccharibacteria bacterium]|nr:MAG: glutamine amidotransferase [Candidatus Saccharibacteria bacterium]PID99565.1 MAG: glutamine amidotransferase [Candidatus Saccharibacteria bacterium]